MANTLTALAPTLFSVAQEVAAEPFGAVDSINANFDSKGVAIGDTVTVPVAPTRSASDYTPAMTTTAGTDGTAASVAVQITKNRHVSWHLTGEQVRSLENGGNADEWVRQLIGQGMRALRNEAEADCVAAIYKGASRAVGTAGTTPFASTLDLMVDARKILRDNGAPMSDLQMVIDTAAGANLFKLGIIQNAYQAGTEEERRTGRFLRQFGFRIQESAGISTHTKGTGTSYQLSAAGAVGDTSINVDTGSGTLLAGDCVTFAGTSTVYVVNTAISGGVFAIGKPGLRAAEADNDAVTIGNDYTPNLAFERGAVVGVMRPPLIPPNANIQQRTISDGRGMTYLLCQIQGDGMVTWRLHLAWGFKAVQSEYIALIRG